MERSFETTPKETFSILQFETLALLPLPTEIALSRMFENLLADTSALLPLKSTPSPLISEKKQSWIVPLTKSPSKASEASFEKKHPCILKSD